MFARGLFGCIEQMIAFLRLCLVWDRREKELLGREMGHTSEKQNTKGGARHTRINWWLLRGEREGA